MSPPGQRFLGFRAPTRLSALLFAVTLILYSRVFGDVAFSALNSFRGTNGSQPFGTLFLATNGLFYGTTAHGGEFDNGAIFSATSSGTINLVASFDGSNGSAPLTSLIQSSDGLLYGTASSGGDFDQGTIFSASTDGVLTVLYSFDQTNGSRPLSPLLLGLDGNFYGTTSLGGAFNMGTIFLLSPTGAVVSLFSFSGTNGAQASGALAQGADGTIYGTTSGGGAYGYGAVFSFTPAAGVTILKSFTGQADGAGPQGGLSFAGNGNLYGTTAAGGSTNSVIGGAGTVFSITTAGAFSTVHSFTTGEGAAPFSPPLQLGNSAFYGTTAAGGGAGQGTVYSFSPNGAYSNVHSFTMSQGTDPHGGIVFGTNGNLFGVTSAGGRVGAGTFFELSAIAPFIILAPTNQTAIEGSIVSFTVTAGGSGPFTFQWQFNSNNLANSKIVSGARTSTLTFFSVTPGQSGNYDVLVQSAAGQILSAAAFLSVIPVPKVSISNPRPNTVIKSPTLKVTGSTAGDAVVTRVYYQLNDEGWLLANTSDNWKHWSATVSAPLGTNELSAFAESVIGTYSTTNSVLFVAPPFIPAAGAYDGLFASSNGFAPESAGFAHLNVDYKGRISAKLQMAGVRSSFTGQFNEAGDATVVFPRNRSTNFTTALHLELDPPDNRITGTISDGSWISDLLVNRATFDTKTNLATSWEGRYTFNIAGNLDSAAAPGGDSFGTITVSKSGRIAVAATLADNTHFSESIPLASDGTFPLFSGIYSGKGLIQGWLALTNPEPSSVGGEVGWYKPALKAAKFYSNGFTLITDASGAHYVPTNIAASLNASNVQLVFEGADLETTIMDTATIDTHNRAHDENGNGLALSFSQSAGTFHGTWTDATSKRKLPFSGAVRQDLGVGLGFFLGTNQSGRMLIGPAPE